MKSLSRELWPDGGPLQKLNILWSVVQIANISFISITCIWPFWKKIINFKIYYHELFCHFYHCETSEIDRPISVSNFYCKSDEIVCSEKSPRNSVASAIFFLSHIWTELLCSSCVCSATYVANFIVFCFQDLLKGYFMKQISFCYKELYLMTCYFTFIF